MKKKIYAFLLMLATLVIAAGCGKKEEAEVDDSKALKEEIVKFVNEDLPGISAERDAAVEIYNQYFEDGASLDSDTWLASLEQTALVDYETYLQNLDSIEVTTPEVTNLKTLFKQSAQNQYDAMTDVVNALKEADTTLLDSAAEKIAISNDYMRQYEEALQRLCTEQGINVEGTFAMIEMATAGDAESESSEEGAAEEAAPEATETTEAE